MQIERTSPMAALLVFTVAPVAAVTGDDQDVSRGMYLRYCASCHDPSGKGDGVAGTFMYTKPADLTQIARKNDRQFPTQRIVQIIDGTNTPRAHGESHMPVWGEALRAEPGSSLGRNAEVQAKIMFITQYLRSIQEK
jgi:mono/diheme cytochrome c family protein